MNDIITFPIYSFSLNKISSLFFQKHEQIKDNDTNKNILKVLYNINTTLLTSMIGAVHIY